MSKTILAVIAAAVALVAFEAPAFATPKAPQAPKFRPSVQKVIGNANGGAITDNRTTTFNNNGNASQGGNNASGGSVTIR